MLKKLLSTFAIIISAVGFAQKKVISLSLASDEILEELQEQCPDKLEIISFSLLADDDSMSFVSEKSRRKVKSRSDSNIEQWVKLKPDFIFASSFNKKETLERLAKFKLAHLVLKPVISLDAIKQNIVAIGTKVGCIKGADKIIQDLDKTIAEFKPMPVSVRGIMYVGRNVVIGKNTVPSEVFSLTGAKNLAAEAGLLDWPTVSSEWLLKLKPSRLIVFEQRAYNEVKNSAFLGMSTKLTQTSGKALFSASHHVVKALEPLRKILTD